MKMVDEQNKGIVNGVFLGYFVLLLHVVLILGLGVVVILVKGIYDFRWLILFAGLVLIGGSGYLFYRRMKESNRKLSDMMNDPALRDRTLEISLLGGMASIKLGHKDQPLQLPEMTEVTEPKQLAAPTSSQVKELGELAKMLEDELISRDEFTLMKNRIVSEK